MTITPYIPPTTVTNLPSGIWSGAYGLPVLPWLPGQTPDVKKAPKWSTQVIRSASGRSRATQFYPYPLWQFELSYEVIRHRPSQDELVTMWEFFNVAMGQFAVWLFVDPTDCQLTTPFQFATGDGSTKSFQLTRPINSWVEPVYATYGQTILDNSGAAGAYTMGPNGVATFTTAPAAGHALTWSGFYYFGCRFLKDDMDFDRLMDVFWAGKAVAFTSERA